MLLRNWTQKQINFIVTQDEKSEDYRVHHMGIMNIWLNNQLIVIAICKAILLVGL